MDGHYITTMRFSSWASHLTPRFLACCAHSSLYHYLRCCTPHCRVAFESFSRRFWCGFLFDSLVCLVIPVLITVVYYCPCLLTLICSKMLSIIATAAVSEVTKNHKVPYFACLECAPGFLVPLNVDIRAQETYDSRLPLDSPLCHFHWCSSALT